MPAHDECNVVRTFWYGSELSFYEELALTSFVKLGHAVQLFSYQPLRAIEGVEYVDASSILPKADVFAYQSGPGQGSFAAFANLFRYKLLHELGGTWVDVDVLCLKPVWQLPSPCFGWQDDTLINCAVMRFPRGHPITKELYDRASERGACVTWGQTGPDLLTEVVHRNNGQSSIMARETFYPISWQYAEKMISPDDAERCEAATADSHCVHWWNEILRRIGVNKNKIPPRGSYLHRRACDILGETRLKAWPEEVLRIAEPGFGDFLRFGMP